MAELNFKTSTAEFSLIQDIAERAVTLAYQLDPRSARVPKLEVVMDLTACHLNACPLQLDALLKADDFNLIHDVFGIRRHLDRDTGKLGGFFTPRFARRGAAKAGPKPQHVHNWCPTTNDLIDRCSVCGEERA